MFVAAMPLCAFFLGRYNNDIALMFHTGLVLSFGIAVTALNALFVVPSLIVLLPQRFRKMLLLMPLLFAMTGCASLSGKPPFDLDEAKTFEDRFFAPQTRLCTMKTRFLWYEFTMLVVVKTTPGTLQAIGTAANGMTLFNVKVEKGVTTRRQFSNAIPDIARERVFGSIEQDLANIFTNDGLDACRYGGRPCCIEEKHSGHFPRRHWKAIYCGWNQESGAFQKITYKDYRTRITFTFEPR